MPRLNPNAGLKPLHKRWIVDFGAPVALKGRQQNSLVVLVRRECAGDTGDSHIFWILSLSGRIRTLLKTGEFLRVQPVVRKFMSQFGQ